MKKSTNNGMVFGVDFFAVEYSEPTIKALEQVGK